MSNKSVKQHPFIIPGQYDGLISGYSLVIVFNNGKESEPIEMVGGVRGFNCSTKVNVTQDGWVESQW